MAQFNDFQIIVTGGDCDREPMLVKDFLDANDQMDIDEVVEILQLQIGQSMTFCWAPGSITTIERMENAG